jgi:hypothetical protein
MGTGGPFPGGKARPRRDADHCRGQEWVGAIPPLPQAPPWRVAALLCFALDISGHICPERELFRP